jgi:hypothetical protein
LDPHSEKLYAIAFDVVEPDGHALNHARNNSIEEAFG